MEHITSQVFLSSEVLWLFGQRMGASAQRKLGKRVAVRGGQQVGEEWVDFDCVG